MKNLVNRIINGLVCLQTPLKAFELTVDRLFSKYGIKVKELENDNLEELKTWLEIINNSYDDCVYNIEKSQTLTN